MSGARPRVAIAHDYLTQRGGAERVVLADGTAVTLSGAEWAGADGADRVLDVAGTRHLVRFRLEGGLPVWT